MSRFDQLLGSVGKKKAAPQSLEPPSESAPETSEPQATKLTSASSKAKGKNPNYQRTTIYLPKDIHREFKMAALEKGEEMSDIVESLVSQWLAQKNV